MTSTEIKSRELIIEQINKLVEKYDKKVEKEKAKRDQAKVTYQGIEYTSESELQDAYACDCFSSATYDRLLNKLEKARGTSDRKEMTESELLVSELQMIKSNFQEELRQAERLKEQKEQKAKRMQELQAEGYSYRESMAIIGNEELM